MHLTNLNKTVRFLLGVVCTVLVSGSVAQNMVGDGFGARSWYKPYSMSAGCYFGFAICGDDHQLYSWGHNEFGELGDGTIVPSTAPKKVVGMTDVFFSSTGYLSGVIRGDLSAWVWGRPYGGIPFKWMDNVRYLSAGDRSITIIKYDGTVWHLGDNETGKFSNGSYSTAILTEDGDVYAAGRNYHGGLGQPESVVDAKFPMKIEGLKDIINIKARALGFAALDKHGDVWSWGMWLEGVRVFEPIKLEGLSNVVSISGKNDGWHFLALTEDKKCFAWGRNQYSQMGTDGLGGDMFQPYEIASDVVEIMAGETFSYIIKEDGNLYCVGMSKDGSIWLGLDDKRRFRFIEIDYEFTPIGLCKPRRRLYIYLDTLICENESLRLFGKEYRQSGRYFEVRSHGDCDSVIVLDLIKGTNSVTNQEIKLCGSETYSIKQYSYL